MPEGDGVVSARPTVKIDGQERPEMEQAVLAATIYMAEGGPDSLELRLNDWGNVPGGGTGFAFTDLNFDTQIETFIGRSRDRPAFKGSVVGIEKQFGPRAPEIILRAFDKLYKLQRKRRSKAWEQMSVADIVRQIASDAGLRAECDIDMRGTFHQLNLSDFNFLHALSARFATTVRLEGDTLVMKREDAAGDPILLKIDGNLRRLSVRFSTVRQPGKAKVSGYDLKAGEAFTKIRDRLSGVFDGETAADFVTDEELFPRPHPRSAGEAEAYARGAFDAVALNFLTGEAVINGDPDCRPGRVVSVEGADARFNGEYKIVSATHRFDSTHGYETFLMIARGWIRRQ